MPTGDVVKHQLIALIEHGFLEESREVVMQGLRRLAELEESIEKQEQIIEAIEVLESIEDFPEADDAI